MNPWIWFLLIVLLFGTKKLEDQSGRFSVGSFVLLLPLLYMALKG
jgi:hypothetical protein